MMAVKPILFNTEMVQAILEGRKTQTRRIVKGIEGIHPYRAEPAENAYDTLAEWEFLCGEHLNGGYYDFCQAVKAPYAVGDVLWVRETWTNIPVSPGGHFRIGGRYYYKADGDQRPTGWQGAWKPSIHMPKKAARIFLKVNAADCKDSRMDWATRQRRMDSAKKNIAAGLPQSRPRKP